MKISTKDWIEFNSSGKSYLLVDCEVISCKNLLFFRLKMAKNIKELNTRVDELAYQFQQGINEVKKLFDTSTMGQTVGPSTSEENELS